MAIGTWEYSIDLLWLVHSLADTFKRISGESGVYTPRSCEILAIKGLKTTLKIY